MTQVLSEKFQNHLETAFNPSDIAQLAQARSVQSPYAEDQSVNYGRINQGHGVPTLIINGFSESITSLSPLALEMARDQDGTKHDVILAEQQRKGGYEKGQPAKSAITSQARDYLAVLKQETDGGPVQLVGHSMAALVIQEMLRIDEVENADARLLEGADIALISPTGTHTEENLVKLGGRFMRHMITENVSMKSFKDKTWEMLGTCIVNVGSNFRRTWAEIRAMSKERMDYPEVMARGIGSLAVVNFGKDRLFPDSALDEGMEQAREAGAAVFMPIELDNESISKASEKGAKRARLVRPLWNAARKLMGISQETVVEEPASVNLEEDNLLKHDFSQARYKIIKALNLDAETAGNDTTLANKLKPRKLWIRGATHNDGSFTPSRTSNALKQYFETVELERRRKAEQEAA